jgi:hypothetical protein
MSLAIVRPDGWNFPLFLHVLGAMTFVAVLAIVAVLLVIAARSDDRAGTLRFAFRTLLYGGIPSYVVFRVGAEWIASKEDLADSNATWIGIGYGVSDVGLLLLIVVSVLLGMASRRARRDPPTGARLVRPATALTLLLIVAYVVALWAMATKPT